MPRVGGYGGSRVVEFHDFAGNLAAPYDDHGHGTHVAGIIAGNGAASGSPFHGVAPNAYLIALKALDSAGQGNVSNVLAALNWCVLNRSTYDLRIVNLSLGHDTVESTATDPLCVAVRNCVQQGLVVVCSAGNKGENLSGVTRYGGISTPGSEPAAITEGASNTKETIARTDDLVCTYSSRGPTAINQHLKPDVLAPGNKIVSLRSAGSTLDANYPQNRVAGYNNQYFALSGTSMAAPQVAGAAALMLQVNPNLTPSAVKALLMYTAEDIVPRDSMGAPMSTGLAALTQGQGA